MKLISHTLTYLTFFIKLAYNDCSNIYGQYEGNKINIIIKK